MWFFVGFIVIALGLVMVRYYKEIADMFGWGASSYDRYRIVAIVMTMIGVLMVFNLHTFIINSVLTLLFGGIMKQP